MVEQVLEGFMVEEPLMAAVEAAVWRRARTARLAVSAAEVVALAQGPCHTLDMARASTSRRRRTSMLGVVAISMQFDAGEISHASSPAAA